MTQSELKCNICNGEITQYFSEKYNGNRGKCPRCEVNFPLD